MTEPERLSGCELTSGMTQIECAVIRPRQLLTGNNQLTDDQTMTAGVDGKLPLFQAAVSSGWCVDRDAVAQAHASDRGNAGALRRTSGMNPGDQEAQAFILHEKHIGFLLGRNVMPTLPRTPDVTTPLRAMRDLTCQSYCCDICFAVAVGATAGCVPVK